MIGRGKGGRDCAGNLTSPKPVVAVSGLIYIHICWNVSFYSNLKLYKNGIIPQNFSSLESAISDEIANKQTDSRTSY